MYKSSAQEGAGREEGRTTGGPALAARHVRHPPTAEKTAGHTPGVRGRRWVHRGRQPPPEDRRGPSGHPTPHAAGSRAPPGSAAASISASTRPPVTLGSTRST